MLGAFACICLRDFFVMLHVVAGSVWSRGTVLRPVSLRFFSENRSGLKTAPCSTPRSIALSSEVTLSMRTRYERPLKKSMIQQIISGETLAVISFIRRPWCHTVSKAAAMSKNSAIYAIFKKLSIRMVMNRSKLHFTLKLMHCAMHQLYGEVEIFSFLIFIIIPHILNILFNLIKLNMLCFVCVHMFRVY